MEIFSALFTEGIGKSEANITPVAIPSGDVELLVFNLSNQGFNFGIVNRNWFDFFFQFRLKGWFFKTVGRIKVFLAHGLQVFRIYISLRIESQEAGPGNILTGLINVNLVILAEVIGDCLEIFLMRSLRQVDRNNPFDPIPGR